MEFKDILKRLRERNNLTQQQLADKSGLSRISIGNYERGDRKPNIEITQKLARALDVNINYLLGNESYIKEELVKDILSALDTITKKEFPPDIFNDNQRLDMYLSLKNTPIKGSGFKGPDDYKNNEIFQLLILIINSDVYSFFDIFKRYPDFIIELDSAYGNLISNSLSKMNLSLSDFSHELENQEYSKDTHSIEKTNFPNLVNQKFGELFDVNYVEVLTEIENKYLTLDLFKNCSKNAILGAIWCACNLRFPLDYLLDYVSFIPQNNTINLYINYKGYIQLALRSGQYKTITVVDIHEGEFVKFNPLTEELVLDFEKRESNTVIGYAGYFKLLNGFEKTIYWNKENIESQSLNIINSFDNTAKTFVINNLLREWGLLTDTLLLAWKYEDITFTDNFFTDFPIE